MSSEDPFEGMGDDFDVEKIALEEVAKKVVPLFQSFLGQGLSVQEAAAVTAAIVAQGMPYKPQGPKED